MKTLIFAAVTAILAGVVAFAFAQEEREPVPQAPVQEARQTAPEEPETADLVAPEVIEEEQLPVVEELDDGRWVCEDGHVWDPLSFDEPQVRNNGDGTVTMRKLARLYDPDGTMREVPVKVVAAPRQERLAVQQRVYPEPDAQEESADGDGE